MKASPPASKTLGHLLRVGMCGLGLLLASCHSDEQAALNLISDRGITATDEGLLEALNTGDLALANALVTLGKGVAVRDAMGRTPLMLASGSGAPKIVRDLAEGGADLEAVDSTGRMALSYALEAGDLEVMVALLDAGADPSVMVDTGGSLTAQALRRGRQAGAILLLEAGADLDSRGPSGESLARIAVEENQPVVLQKMASLGADFSVPDAAESGERSLAHLALELGRDEIFTFFLKQGVNPDEKNKKGEALVHTAVAGGKVHLLPALAKRGASLSALDPQGWSALHLAILARDHDLLNTLLDLGADVDLYSGQGLKSVPPLSLAIENRLFPMAALLLRHGAKPRDEMYQAVVRGGQDGQHLVKLLLENGASPSPTRAPSLDSPIGLAVRKGEYEIAKLLLDAGVSFEQRDLCGQKPLHIAVALGHRDLVGLLLDKGADPNEPFHPEVSDGFLDLVKTEGIGRWALKKSKELYPIMLAADSGNVEVAQQLIDHGASTTKSTKVSYNRMWPLTFATRRSDVKMMQVVLGRKPGRSQLWIRVDLSEQRAYLFDGDDQIYKTRVSTGKKGHRTRQGKFVITNKYRDWESTIYGSSMPYFQRLSASDFGFHVGYVPSYPASHGCIRMPHSAAKKLFGMTKVGDYVEIVP